MTVDYSTYKCIKVEVEDGVAIATMNRPEVLNAINDELNFELHRLFPEGDS